jgi:hypothetical protein
MSVALQKLNFNSNISDIQNSCFWITKSSINEKKRENLYFICSGFTGLAKIPVNILPHENRILK